MNLADPTASHVLDRVLVLEMVRVTEAAAVAASKLIGRGDEKAADAAAVEAMRAALNQLPFDGTVVIGEGERDEAPMLYIGEKVGTEQGTGPKVDIALDPLEGTTLTAKAGPNALAVLAIAESGERKTTCDNLALESVKAHQNALAASHADEMKHFENANAIAAGERRRVENDKELSPDTKSR